jgi:hypothetical protein
MSGFDLFQPDESSCGLALKHFTYLLDPVQGDQAGRPAARVRTTDRVPLFFPEGGVLLDRFLG